MKLVRDEGYRYRDISIITKNIATYSSLAKAIFDKYDIPIFIDENRDLIYWKESEGKENASIIEHDVVAFYQWNEYVFYMVYRTEHKNDTKLYIYWWTNIGGVPAKKWFVGAGGFVTQLSYYEIVGNDEYIFILGDNVVSNYWIEGYLKGNGVELEEGIHNLRVVDYMSFLYDDANGNTHYYDMETDSEQPIPEDAMNM